MHILMCLFGLMMDIKMNASIELQWRFYYMRLATSMTLYRNFLSYTILVKSYTWASLTTLKDINKNLGKTKCPVLSDSSYFEFAVCLDNFQLKQVVA